MPETRTHTDLGEESLGVDGRGHLVAQDFHRDAPPQRTLFSEIHVSGHAALQRSFEPVPEAQGVSNTGKIAPNGNSLIPGQTIMPTVRTA